MKTVLIVGGSGYMGTHIAMRLREEYKVFATYGSHPIQIPGVTCLPMKVHDVDWGKRVVYTTVPDIVIYAAGNSEVAWAEANPREAEKLHVTGPGLVLKAATVFQPKFIYLSTAYVFDGHRGNYHEPDIVLASTALGRLKVNGENLVKSRALNYNILRLSPVYGRGNGFQPSFLDTLRTKLSRGERCDVPGNELHSFLPINAAVDLIARLAESGPRNKVLHYGGLTKCTHFDFARKFATRFGFNSQLVTTTRSTTAKEKMLLDANQLDYSLNSSEVMRTLKVESFLLEQGFDLFNKHLVAAL